MIKNVDYRRKKRKDWIVDLGHAEYFYQDLPEDLKYQSDMWVRREREDEYLSWGILFFMGLVCLAYVYFVG